MSDKACGPVAGIKRFDDSLLFFFLLLVLIFCNCGIFGGIGGVGSGCGGGLFGDDSSLLFFFLLLVVLFGGGLGGFGGLF
ncbi:MAG: hypothetical protein K0R93_1598 [Anaerosolibacter sp.]|jgi:hypothetical protein|uniref:hypothetical protein n=1 Tax=Anaerosolibacter sp. TaxID=1872527 RepID=UPI00262516D8|nr:hypothetical protein [Anaerosolibacter sp.]MDF2546700.1 hypothetical protein [Anaerosolibacter sp.]